MRSRIDIYLDPQRDFQLLGVFAGISIVIAMLGLVGLAAHTVVARTKEIAVRRVARRVLGDEPLATLVVALVTRPRPAVV